MASSPSSTWPTSHAERAAFMSAAWDEEISLGLQEEEIWEASPFPAEVSNLPWAPLPCDLPLPFAGQQPALHGGEAAPVAENSPQPLPVELVGKDTGQESSSTARSYWSICPGVQTFRGDEHDRAWHEFVLELLVVVYAAACHGCGLDFLVCVLLGDGLDL